MENQPEIYEYELIDICFQSEYELQEEDAVWLVCEDAPINDLDTTQIEYDADGIPMGRTIQEKLMRREIIHKFIQNWRASHEENPCIYNKNLKENIKINQLFLLESVAHSAVQYRSTKAILQMEEVMANAIKIGLTAAKNNSNQKSFQQMIVMQYRSDELGSIKMTVGIRRRTLEKIQYSITAHETGVEFIDDGSRIAKNMKKRKKRSK